MTGLRDDPSVIDKKAREMLQEGSTNFLKQLDSMVPNKAPPSDILREGLVVMTQASNGKGYKSTITQVSKDPTTNEKVYDVQWEDGTTDRDFKAASIKPISSPRVLVVDETYDLRPQSDTQGRAIYNGLMRVMEDNRQDVSVIFAGYPKSMEGEIFAFNSGFSPSILASRLTKITFVDYDNDELAKIWDVMCTKKQMTSSPEARQYAVRIASRKRGTPAFGNARDVRKVLDAATRKVTARAGGARIEVGDVGVWDPTVNNPALAKVLKEVDDLVGQQKVKDHIHGVVEQAKEYFEKEFDSEKAPRLLQLNRIFTGNPGTGKTTVAKLFARVLTSLGLVSDSEVQLKLASDLKGGFVGETTQKTARALDEARGKVLVIDEAYALDDALFGKEALDTLVSKVAGEGEDRSVILIGYGTSIRDMLANQNPGLKRRFAIEVEFIDYGHDDFRKLIPGVLEALSYSKPLSGDAMEFFLDRLALKQKEKNFGNVGTAETMITLAIQKMKSHKRTELVGTDFLEKDAEHRGEPLKYLEDLAGLTEFRVSMEEFIGEVIVRRREGRSLDNIRKNLNTVFQGNPGTGKTTIAKRLALILYSLDLISKPNIIVTDTASLIGNVVGQSKTNLTQEMERALGGVLFIDEAHQLRDGIYQKEVREALVTNMTLDRFKGVVVVIGGYKAEIDALFRTDPGLGGRFKKRYTLPDIIMREAAEQCVRIIKSQDFKVPAEEDIVTVLEAGFRQLSGLGEWSNFRDVENVAERIMKTRDGRVYKDDSHPEILKQDAEKGIRSLISERPALCCASHHDPMPAHLQMPVAYGNAAPAERSTYRERQAPVAVGQQRPPLPDTPDAASVPEEEKIKLAEKIRSREDGLRQELARMQEDKVREGTDKQQQEYRLELERQLRELEAQREHERRMEEEALRAKDEAARRVIEAELQRVREAQATEQRKQEALRRLMNCPMGFAWRKVSGGYVCYGGSHHVSDDQLQREYMK